MISTMRSIEMFDRAGLDRVVESIEPSPRKLFAPDELAGAKVLIGLELTAFRGLEDQPFDDIRKLAGKLAAGGECAQHDISHAAPPS
jgi:hypothetical protein